MFKLNHFPGCWKTGRILPILKLGKDPTQPISYRPISLLPTLSKLSEKIILNRYIKHAKKVRIPIPQQFGFTPQLSTIHQLLRVTEHILEGKFANLATAAIFLDIAKAFDKVWSQGLIHKLIAYKFPHYIISIIHSYLQDRQFVVKVKNTDSSPRNIHAGMPQGGILSPIIFLCFMNDIPQQKDITLSLYADDTAILAQSKKFNTISNSLSKYIPKLESWLKRWKIQLNVEKTEAIIFSKYFKHCPEIKIYSTPVPWKKEIKYLGVILDRNLTFRPHLNHIKEKYNKAFRAQYSLICRNSRISIQNKLLICQAYLRPILTYASLVWAFTAKFNFNIIQVLENKTIRMTMQADWYIRNADIRKSTSIPSLKDFIIKLSDKFYNNLSQIDNTAISNIPSYDSSHEKFRKRPRAMFCT
ncbi:RNA-directed DNA polymerase from mobile element jockey [Araneus ventricosus]|uniref:RNA-directed DNA polymerase from mobile element jockey n=1 Tax=Araneus ventricosus TaxID=182803 RepID=A0A4Y2I5Z8_ARAVE|nr:RNA-directed DNA polymerase from mobile element jockey [Araneus ventricosus]